MLSDEAMALSDTTDQDRQFQHPLLGLFAQKHQEDTHGALTRKG